MQRSKNPPPRGNRRGFTFVEVLVASAILAVSAVGIAGALVQAPKVSRAAREEMSARASMRGMVSEVSAAPYSGMATAFAGTGFDVLGLEAPDGDADGLPGSVLVEEVLEGGAQYYRVTLSVDWHGVNGNRSIVSVHYVSNARGDTADPDTPDVTTDPNTSTTDDPLATPIVDPLGTPIIE
jgi:prepilin-type N-terminal cleavage/methylation domain-containing protein